MTYFGLTRAQVSELKLIREEDEGYLARGDQADLVGIGLAKPPSTACGFYQLTNSGWEAWRAVNA